MTIGDKVETAVYVCGERDVEADHAALVARVAELEQDLLRVMEDRDGWKQKYLTCPTNSQLVAEERERCAQVALDYNLGDDYEQYRNLDDASERIAQAIRNGGKVPS